MYTAGLIFFTILPYICAIGALYLITIIVSEFWGLGSATGITLIITAVILLAGATDFAHCPDHLYSVKSGAEEAMSIRDDIVALAEQTAIPQSDYDVIKVYNDNVDNVIALRKDLEQNVYGRILCNIFHSPSETDIIALKVRLLHNITITPEIHISKIDNETGQPITGLSYEYPSGHVISAED